MRTITVRRILGYRFGSSTSFKLQQVEKRWSHYVSHLFLHAIVFLPCTGNPFFAAFPRSVRTNDCCCRVLCYRFGSSTSFKLQQVQKRWSNYLFHLLLHAIAFLACLGNPFFAAFARLVRVNDCYWLNSWLPVRLIHLL